MLARGKEYREHHKEEISIRHKKWYIENKRDVQKYNIKHHKDYNDKHKEKVKIRRKEWRDNLRKIVLEHYGNKCACCGETAYEFLAIDHINNDGGKQRKQIGKGGMRTYIWAKKNNFPNSLQVLCHNCNLAKGFYGECPHQKRNKSNL